MKDFDNQSPALGVPDLPKVQSALAIPDERGIANMVFGIGLLGNGFRAFGGMWKPRGKLVIWVSSERTLIRDGLFRDSDSMPMKQSRCLTSDIWITFGHN